ncbi:MAG: aldehyde dehydrogenase family protein [Proteobacteria bacterium]|nr:aldehyde dehydrogenase family protein [Pseudomonadota bacterium]
MNPLKNLGIDDLHSGLSTGADWLESDGPLNESVSPIDGKPIAKIRTASKTDYEIAVQAAQKAFPIWREVPAPKRGEIVRQIGNAVRESKEDLGRLVSMEMGKIFQEGLGEVQEMIDICDFAVGQSRQLYGFTMASERPGHRMYDQYHPLGLVGLITAFNFPVAVWSWNAMIAAICGNVSLWKPSPKTPLCSIALQRIVGRVLKENGMPEGVMNLVIGSNEEIGETLIADRRFPLISATGSTRMGRLIIHESIYDQVKTQLVRAYQQLDSRIGNPLSEGILIGPMIDAEAVKTFQNALEQIKKQGGTILTGGESVQNVPSGLYVRPVLAEAENHWEIVQEETFGPLLYLIRYQNFDDALKLQNDVPQGLSSAIFTNDLKESEKFLSHAGSDCGLANVNIGTSGAEIGGAFGGEKDTGGGRESGSDAWKAYMRRQTNTINYSPELPLAQGITFDLG